MPQCALEAHIEIDIEVAHSELAQAAISRLAITAAGEVRFRDRAPMSPDFENGDHMIGVALGFKIEDERRKSEHPQSGGGKNSTLETRGGAIVQNFTRRACGVTEVVRQFIEKLLNAHRRFQWSQQAPFRSCETEITRSSHKGRKGHGAAEART